MCLSFVRGGRAKIDLKSKRILGSGTCYLFITFCHTLIEQISSNIQGGGGDSTGLSKLSNDDYFIVLIQPIDGRKID